MLVRRSTRDGPWGPFHKDKMFLRKNIHPYTKSVIELKIFLNAKIYCHITRTLLLWHTSDNVTLTLHTDSVNSFHVIKIDFKEQNHV